jgi:hypothetical protein
MAMPLFTLKKNYQQPSGSVMCGPACAAAMYHWVMKTEYPGGMNGVADLMRKNKWFDESKGCELTQLFLGLGAMGFSCKIFEYDNHQPEEMLRHVDGDHPMIAATLRSFGAHWVLVLDSDGKKVYFDPYPPSNFQEVDTNDFKELRRWITCK